MPEETTKDTLNEGDISIRNDAILVIEANQEINKYMCKLKSFLICITVLNIGLDIVTVEDQLTDREAEQIDHQHLFLILGA